ncbi:potassium/proton antiporter [Chelativorans sp. SCAU2101]|jgi:NhaP-type Na+/H+ and K+/H+ antiporters with a unique C-terminal domain|uniref:Potassium/proton antiporter n=1 Tax=Chelativorans petroleitrophicus TaxID=2975484 RepID=A0A9X2X584_9HYPH|nr:potassium/proton antiporter [Chelativorans petroleitrophicus]MCT8988713.1 potassium/proton antiporter [Chelativorans petroleitrophicus]
MDQSIYLITLIATALVLFAAFSSLIAFRFGAPLLLVFLGIGLAAGTDGLGLDFDNASLAFFVGSLALAVILFDSGFGTSLATLRNAAAPAVVLATFGVVLTAGLVGIATYFIAGFNWLESFLLGATIASTDAAAVFFLLRVGNISVRDKVRSTLEVESGSNDPIAIFLTLSLISLIASGAEVEPGDLAADIALGFLQQMGIGLTAGLAGGYMIVRLVTRLNLDRGLLPIFVLALSLLVFALAGALGGSGFIAVYVAGIVAGNAQLRSTAMLKRFQDGMTWLAQIIMFLVLGLLATPSQFTDIALPAVLIGLFLIFVARPLAVTICLLPFHFTRAETAFISWVGLRGAVSVLLAILPMIDELDQGRTIFNIVFIMVLVSLLVQGWSVAPLARRLGLVVPARIGPVDKVELELPGSARHELLAYRVVAGSPVERGQRIPRWARPSLVVRDGRSMAYQYAGRLMAGDRVYIFVPDRYPVLLDRLFASPAAVDPEDAEFFGAFALDPSRPAADIEAAYALGLSEEDQALTIAEFVRKRLGGRAEYGDRLALGEIELIVRDVDDEGRITGIGLSVDPPARPAEVPVFLSIGEALSWLWNFLMELRRRKKKTVEAEEAAGEPVQE